MIIDHWNPLKKQYRLETFCYDPTCDIRIGQSDWEIEVNTAFVLPKRHAL
ncbi:MAG: hypothetical protein ACK41E_07145 [Deinococcales bacterium]